MINEKLRLLRIEKGVSQQDVANYLEISRQAYNHYETGKRGPEYPGLQKLCKYYDVSLDWLMGQSRYRNKREMIKYAWIDYEFSDPNFDPAFDFAPFLKKVRVSHGISTKEMAGVVRGFTEDNYIKVENGELPLLISNAYYFCKHLSTTIEDILDANNIMYKMLSADAYYEKQKELENTSISSELFWIYDLQVMLKQAGYGLTFKKNNNKELFYIDILGKNVRVSEDDLKSINNSINEFIRFKMFEVKNKKEQ